MATARLVKSGTSSFRSEQRARVQQRRSLDKARIKARQIKKAGGSATAQLFGGKAFVVETKAPELFSITGERATARIERVDGKNVRVIEGFTRADLTRQKALSEQLKNLEAERKKAVNKFTAGEVVKRSLPTSFLVQEAAKKPSVREISSYDIVSRLPTATKVRQLTKPMIPTKKRVEFEKQELNIVPLDTRINKIEDLKKGYASIEKKTSRVLGLEKISKELTKPRTEFKGDSILGKAIDRTLFGKIAPKPIKSFGKDVAAELVRGTLEKPITNTAIILSGAGFARVGQVASIKLLPVLNKIPTLAKTAKIGKVVATGALTIAYVNGVVSQGAQEYANTGKISKTTADAIREILLFDAGAKLGTSKNLSKLNEYRKLLDKLPASQEKEKIKAFNKAYALYKKNPKAFKDVNLGIVEKLDTQQVSRSFKNVFKDKKLRTSEIKDITTVIDNKAFISKKIPKKTNKFFVDTIILTGDTSKGITGLRAQKIKFKATWDSKKGVVVIDKNNPVSRVFLDSKDAISSLKRIGSGVTIKNNRFVTVKPSERVITKVKPSKNIIIDSKGNTLYYEAFKPKRVQVKGFERKLTDVLSVKRSKDVKFFDPKFVEGGDKVLKAQEFLDKDFVQYTISADKGLYPKDVSFPSITKTTKPKKPIRFIDLTRVKLNNVAKNEFKIDPKTLKLVLEEPVSVSKTITKKISKPVVGVSVAVSKSQQAVLVPLKRSVSVSKPKPSVSISKPVQEPRKPISVVFSEFKADSVGKLKPIVRVEAISKSKSDSKIKSVSKPKIGVKAVSAIKEKSVPLIKALSKTKLLKPKFVKPVLPEKIILLKPFIFTKSKKLKIKKFKKPKLVQVTKFTTTILRPKTGKKGKGVKFGEFELFTGGELR